MLFINLHVFQPCVSQRAGGEVDVCCRDPNYKSVDFVSLHHSFSRPNCIFFLYKRTYIFWNIPIYFLLTPGTLGLSRNKQGRKVEHLEATSGGCQRISFYSWWVFPSLNAMNIEYVHFLNCLNFQMEQRWEERSQRCSGKVQSCLQSAARKSCCLQSATTESCHKPGTSEFCT